MLAFYTGDDMTTKSTGTSESGIKTWVTDNRADVKPHKLEEGCGREPMYSHRSKHIGERQSHPADSEYVLIRNVYVK